MSRVDQIQLGPKFKLGEEHYHFEIREKEKEQLTNWAAPSKTEEKSSKWKETQLLKKSVMVEFYLKLEDSSLWWNWKKFQIMI